MRIQKYILLVVGILLGLNLDSHGQFGLITGKKAEEGTATNYSLILSRAEDDFEKGNLSKIEKNLEPGFEKGGFSKEEIIRAHRLLTLVHLFSDNEPKAELELIQLLKSDPEHPINPLTDPAEFQYLYQKFRTKPIFRIAVNAGANRTDVNTIQRFGTTNTIDHRESIAPKIGTQIGLAIEREFGFKGLEASLGVMYTAKKYSLTKAVIGVEGDAFSELNFTEAANYLDVPLMLRYNIDLDSKMIPFVFGGAEGNMLIGSSRKQGTRSGAQTISATDQTLKTTEERNNLNYAIIAGLGFKYKLKTHFFKFELKYSKGQTNVVNSDNRYVDQTTVFRLAQVDDNQSLDAISANIGYVLSIYNPRKLKKYRK
ncbi:MAG: PorT family protein [Cyclobacteriaceae bacterium]